MALTRLTGRHFKILRYLRDNRGWCSTDALLDALYGEDAEGPESGIAVIKVSIHDIRRLGNFDPAEDLLTCYGRGYMLTQSGRDKADRYLSPKPQKETAL